MLKRLFPDLIDNVFPGQILALWLFGALVTLRGLMSVNCVFRGAWVAVHADGVPLQTFPTAAARIIVDDFATWGLMQLMLCLLSILALTRYRAMVPMMLLVFLLEHACRKLYFAAMPVVTAPNAPGAWVNMIIFTLEIAGVALALWPRRTRQSPA